MIPPVLSRIASDTRGASAIEFVLTVPLLVTLLVGTMMVANYLSVRNALKSALDETSRYASLYPTPSDTQLRARFDATLTRKLDKQELTLEIKRVSVSTAIKTIELRASYPVSVKFLFAQGSIINATASKRKVFSAQ